MKMFLINFFSFIGLLFVIYILLYVGYYIYSMKHSIYTSFRWNDPKIFYIFDFIRLRVQDRKFFDKDYFQPHGIILYEGKQGSGKTMSMVYDIQRLSRMYPKCKVIDNLGVRVPVPETDLKHWKQLLDFNNGKFGVICAIDELQVWFSQKDSATMPPQVLGIITQNRKNRRLILGTCQQFYLISKDFRTQTTEVRSAFTLGNVLTGYVRKVPSVNSAGDVVKWRFKGFRIFIQTNQLRDCYDTFKTINKFKDSDFVDPNERSYL